ncbi:MAG: hypothetical protein WBD90_06220, partial [Xanthobacteraceae bacterium]
RFSYPLTIITLNRSSGCGQDGSSSQFAAQNRRVAADKAARVASRFGQRLIVSDVRARSIKVALISIAHISFALREGTTNSDCVCQPGEAHVRDGCNQINAE